MVSTPLKNISQNGNLPKIGVKIKNIWNHHPVIRCSIISVVKIMTPWFPLWFTLSQLHELLGEPPQEKNGTFHWIHLWNFTMATGYWIHRITNSSKWITHCLFFKPVYKLPKSVDHNMILVGGWATHLKNMIVKLHHVCRDRGKKLKKSLKPPGRIQYIPSLKLTVRP